MSDTKALTWVGNACEVHFCSGQVKLVISPTNIILSIHTVRIKKVKRDRKKKCELLVLKLTYEPAVVNK